MENFRVIGWVRKGGVGRMYACRIPSVFRGKKVQIPLINLIISQLLVNCEGARVFFSHIYLYATLSNFQHYYRLINIILMN